MKYKEIYTIVHTPSGYHYDTNEEKFYSDEWEWTEDNKIYLEMLVNNNPEKFKDCVIQNNKE